MKKMLNDFGGLTTVIFIVGAVLIALLLVFISMRQSAVNIDLNSFENTQRLSALERQEGDPFAKIKMIEFSDFQCPYCKLFHEKLMPEIRKEFIDTGIATLEYYPMVFLGPDSINASKGAICAQDQNQFWFYHDLLFHIQSPDHNNGTFNESSLFNLADYIHTQDENFNLSEFERCYNSGEAEVYLSQLERQATAYGIQSTPTLVINDVAIRGVQDISVYRQVIDKILEDKQ
jgi:protein-disulfide isomerase|tara:strand:- start:162 stop:857 length:696 start_codon:yes stop_codon:yes gene_type:complete